MSTTALFIEEATIAEFHEALAAGRTTCVEIVQAHLDRIAAYDEQGPALNALITVNPRAIEIAKEQDARRARGVSLPPLHGVVVIVKDNYDTADMPTTGRRCRLSVLVTAWSSGFPAGSTRPRGALSNARP